MVFNSYLFVLAFLPLVVIGYFLLNKLGSCVGKIFLAVASFAFFAYGGLKSAAVFIVSILANIIFSLLLQRVRDYKKAILIISIIFNVLILFIFKYFNFFAGSVAKLFGSDFTLENLILPLGISFFTFQQIMYTVNVYRGEIKDINILDYLVYILYFPKILMGPLTEPKDFIAQLNDSALKKVDWNNIVCGLKIFSFGLFKKLVFADMFRRAVDFVFVWQENSTSLEWLLVTLFYTLEIYFDFSGYSDMAVGISKMLNISLPINFDSPYKAFSIRDFWKRWHISLTTFLTKYIYIPLGGNQKGKTRTYINIMLVFLISGIWHGANFTFILWGVIHGLLCVFDRVVDGKKITSKKSDKVASAKDNGKTCKNKITILKVFRALLTFIAVNFLWLLFRAGSIAEWGSALGKIFSFQSMTLRSNFVELFSIPESSILTSALHISPLTSLAAMIIMTALALFICFVPENNYKTQDKISWPSLVFAALALLISLLCISAGSSFVYMYF